MLVWPRDSWPNGCRCPYTTSSQGAGCNIATFGKKSGQGAGVGGQWFVCGRRWAVGSRPRAVRGSPDPAPPAQLPALFNGGVRGRVSVCRGLRRRGAVSPPILKLELPALHKGGVGGGLHRFSHFAFLTARCGARHYLHFGEKFGGYFGRRVVVRGFLDSCSMNGPRTRRPDLLFSQQVVFREGKMDGGAQPPIRALCRVPVPFLLPSILCPLFPAP
jgi:hypothetical protein